MGKCLCKTMRRQKDVEWTSKRYWMNVKKMLNECQKDVEWMSKRCWMNVKKMLNDRQKGVEWTPKRCWMNVKRCWMNVKKMLNERQKGVEWTSKRCWTSTITIKLRASSIIYDVTRAGNSKSRLFDLDIERGHF